MQRLLNKQENKLYLLYNLEDFSILNDKATQLKPQAPLLTLPLVLFFIDIAALRKSSMALTEDPL